MTGYKRSILKGKVGHKQRRGGGHQIMNICVGKQSNSWTTFLKGKV